MGDYNYSYELIHHGVKGMKWGVRRYQNKDGSLTAAGKKQSNEQTNTNKKISTSTKVAIGVGVAAAVAAGIYFTKKYMDMNCDKIITKGAELQRMSRTVDEMLNKPFYVSYLKSDNKAYARNDLFGTNWKYKKTLTSNSNIKVAGRRASIEAFRDFIKTEQDARERFKGLDITNKRAVRSAYDKFNRDFVSPDIRDRALRDSYLRKLAERGYDAVRDRNDQLYSRKRSPILVFGKLGDITVKQIIEANNQ